VVGVRERGWICGKEREGLEGKGGLVEGYLGQNGLGSGAVARALSIVDLGVLRDLALALVLLGRAVQWELGSLLYDFASMSTALVVVPETGYAEAVLCIRRVIVPGR
jgi:hypothetical protein